MINQTVKKFRLIYYILTLLFLLGLIFFIFKNSKTSQNTTLESEGLQNNLTSLILGTDWFAQAEHGGFYQAVSDGTYHKYGLNVQVKMGGPQINGIQMLLSGEIDFYIPASFLVLTAAQQKLPIISVAAIFQKDIQILMAHPNVGHDTFEALKGKSIMISPPTVASIWRFLVGKYAYDDSQKKSFSHSMVPFLQDKNAIQEGILTSEPFVYEKMTKKKPISLLLADVGFSGYGELLTTTKKFEKDHPDVVQKFVSASLEGWKNYLQNPKPGNMLIKEANPEMKNDLLEFAHKKLIEENVIVDKFGSINDIGKMSDKRWLDFVTLMQSYNALEKNIDYKSVYTLKYINIPNSIFK